MAEEWIKKMWYIYTQWNTESEVKVEVTQLCRLFVTHGLYTVHGILQARILEWVAFLFSRGSSQPRDRIRVSHIAGRFLME